MGALDLLSYLSSGRNILHAVFASKPQPVKLMNLRFPNILGLAAGFDKDGKHIRGLAALGFGFIEVGTVTPLPQTGNPKPRLFRLPCDNALINRMGFNNAGLDALVEKLKKIRSHGTPYQVLIGGNIGKNKNTPNEKAVEDYLLCFNKLHDLVDYFVVNVSSPNTPNLRDLQEKKPLTTILNALQNQNRLNKNPKPILLKIAPDLNDTQLHDIAEIVQTTNIAGIVATNTTISRENLKTPSKKTIKIGSGGLSGYPLQGKATHCIKKLRDLLGPNAVIIAVGGINNYLSAKEKIDAGANLVQIYTGLVYEGPGIIKNILNPK